MHVAADPRSLTLSELSECAYRLGMGFGRAAEQAEAWERRLECFELFERCFFAVRVSTALQLRLARAPDREAASEREGLERERAERGDAPERDIAPERDRDRERDVEPATMPVLLRTLEGVAANAAALPGPQPAALPTLRQLLTHMKSAPALAAAPTAGQGLRARLASSGAVATLTLPPAPRPGRKIRLPIRRATGPPRR